MANADGRSGSTGDAGDIVPGLEGTVTGGAMVDGGQAMAAKLEQVVDPAVAGEEPLGMARRLEPLHLSFSSSCRLVRDLGLVVEVTALPMYDPRQDLSLGGTIAAQLVRQDHTGCVLQPFQQLLEEVRIPIIWPDILKRCRPPVPIQVGRVGIARWTGLMSPR